LRGVRATMATAMATPSSAPRDRDRTTGLALGLVGVLLFSATLPATRIAVAELHPALIGLGRAMVAAVVAGLVLAVTGQRRPTAGEWRRLGVVAGGVVIGFPLCSAIAMRSLPASHAAILIGLMPLATTAAAAWLAHEQPSRGFWIVAGTGSALVVCYGLLHGGGSLSPADLLLLVAVAAGGIGYAEGARLALSLGGWQVISWALVLSAPFLIPPVLWIVVRTGVEASAAAWLAFAYVSLISQYLGFFAWYRGLALGGTARVGQLQLLQPFFTIVLAVWIAGEELDSMTVAFAVGVVVCVAAGRRMPVRRNRARSVA
jgi:drug/metabolite transporter (DMT)-like permease